MIRALLTAVSAAAVFVPQANAQAAPESEANQAEEQVVVTATRMANPAKSIPNTVTVVDQEAITRIASIDDSLAGILERTVPGFAPNSQKMTGGAETLRGKNPLYMIDGIPQHNSLRDGLRDGFTIDSAFLERIEVVQGANAVQGIGATGGVVDMVTLRASGDGEFNHRLDGRLTTDDNFDSDSFGYKVSYVGDIKKDRFDFVGGIAYHERGIYFDANGDRVGFRTAQGELQDSDSRDLFLKFGFEPGADQRIQLMVNDYELENNGQLIPVAGDRDAGIYATSIDGDSSAEIGDPAKNDVTTMSLDYRHSDLGGGLLRVQGFWQDYAALFEGSVSSRWELGDGVPFLDQSQINSEKYGVKTSYELNDVAGVSGLRTLLGLDYAVDESGQTLAQTGRYWVPELDMESLSPFVQVEYLFGDSLLLSTGLRYEMTTLEVDDFVTLPTYNSTFVEGGDPDFNEVLGNVGLVYDLTNTLAVYGSFSQGFDMPDVGRVLRDISVPGLSVDSLVDIKPIITDNLEFGFNYESGRWNGQLSVYLSETDLGSRLVADSEGIYEVRREKQELWGVDVIATWTATDNLLFGVNYAYLQGEYDSDDDGSTDTDMTNANLSPNRLNAFATGNWGAWEAHVHVSHLFDRTQKGDAAFTDYRREFEGYTLVDLNVTYGTSIGTFGLGVENLFNEEYETLYSQTQTGDDRYFSGRGRTLSLNYRVQL